MIPGQTCSTCVFFQKWGTDGECRRYPPTRGLDRRFNAVAPTWWCGEWEEQPVAQEHPDAVTDEQVKGWLADSPSFIEYCKKNPDPYGLERRKE